MTPSTILLLIALIALIYSVIVDLRSDITDPVPARACYALGVAFACFLGAIFAAHI